MRHVFLVVVALGVCAAAAALPRIPQDPAYHVMADRRTIGGVANAFDVASNVPFLFVGAAGIATVMSRRARRDARGPWLVFFGATVATTAGSVYYHLSPGDARVLWDRLPIALAFASLVAAVVTERVDARAGRLAFVPLLAVSACSVVFWYWTELNGCGDLRPYVVVQFGSLVFLVAILLLYREPRSDTPYLVAGLAAYATAKVCELFDARVFALTHFVSGHTLKHVAAAAGVACVVAMLRARRQS